MPSLHDTPPPVHHQDVPRAAAAPPRTATTPRAATAGHRAARTGDAGPGAVAWVPYLLVLAGVAVGVLLAFEGSAGRGMGLLGGSLLAAGLARLVLPPRLAGLLASRGRASDVLAFTALGAGVLAVALMLP